MHRARSGLPRSWLVAGGAAWLWLSSCGGTAFTSADGAGGSASGMGGAAGQTSAGGSKSGTAGTGTAGDMTSAGGPDKGGSGGSGGVVSTSCDCPAGHYCRDGSTDCFDCAELNRLHFAVPERLATLSDNGAGSRFPRVGLTGTDLFFHWAGVGIRYTTDASTSAGSLIKGSIQQDSAPLLLKGDVSGASGLTTLMSFNFVYDRMVEVGRRELYVGEWKNDLGTVELLPAPFNGGKSDFSMAVAPHATPDNIARAFWMTGRDAMSATLGPSLVTALFTANSVGAPVALNVGQAGCTPKDFSVKADPDLSPWVTDDGKTLLVSTTRVDANCAPANQGKDIYTALLQPSTGQPTAAAVPMSDVNSAMDEVDPSFSADLCDLYFASNRDGKFGLYKAHRR